MNEQLAFPEHLRLARSTDPATSHLAAVKVAAGNGDLVAAIRAAVRKNGAMTSWDIAQVVEEEHGNRWAFDTIRTACARAGLVKLSGAKSPRGNNAQLYDLLI